MDTTASAQDDDVADAAPHMADADVAMDSSSPLEEEVSSSSLQQQQPQQPVTSADLDQTAPPDGDNDHVSRRRRRVRPREEEEGSSSSRGDDVHLGEDEDDADDDEREEVAGEVEEEEEEDAHSSIGIRRRKIRRRLSSSSDSSSTSSAVSSSSSSSSSSTMFDVDSSDMPSVEATASTSAEDASAESRPAVLNKRTTKCRYSILSDIINREMNMHHRREFIQNRIGSLSLASRLKLAYKLEGHDGCVNSLDFNQSGSLLASGSDDLAIILWDWQKKEKKTSVASGHKANVFQSKFLPLLGDAHIVSSSRDGQVRLAELSPAGGGGDATRRLAMHKGPANKIALHPDCPHAFLSCGEDGVVFSIDVRDPKPTKLLLQKEADQKIALYSVDANPGEYNLFCTSGRDQYVRIFDRRKVSETNCAPLKKFCPHHMIDSGKSANVTCAVFSHDGSEVMGSYNDEEIYLFRTDHSDGADYRKRYQGHQNSATVKGVNFYGARSEYVISGSDCGNIFLWSKDEESIVHMFAGDDNGVVNVLEPHPNLPFLATSGLDNEVKIWFPTAEKEVDFKQVEKTVIKNCTNRRNRRRFIEPDTFDGQMLYVLMRQIRRTEERRRRLQAMENGGPVEEEPDSSDDATSDVEQDSDEPGGIQCPMS